MKKKWVLCHCDLHLWPKVTKFNRVQVSAGSNHLAKTASKSVHLFRWNFVHKQSQTHRQTQNITCGGVIKYVNNIITFHKGWLIFLTNSSFIGGTERSSWGQDGSWIPPSIGILSCVLLLRLAVVKLAELSARLNWNTCIYIYIICTSKQYQSILRSFCMKYGSISRYRKYPANSCSFLL